MIDIRGVENNFKQFQGQEYTEDLGLNIHEWKYRVSDPAIGRFWQLDPLAEDYMYNSPYAFSENRVIDSAELEGLERIYAADGKFIDQVGDNQDVHVMHHNDANAQALISTANNTEASSEDRAAAVKTLNDNSYQGFSSADEAAKDFVSIYNNASISMDKEFGAAINEVKLTNQDGEAQGSTFIRGAFEIGSKDGTTRFLDVDSFGGAKVNAFGIEIQLDLPGDSAGVVHTHGRGGLDFSGFDPIGGNGDKQYSKRTGLPIYLGNQNGDVRVFKYNKAGPHREGSIGTVRVPNSLKYL